MTQDPVTHTLSITSARSNLSQVVNQVFRREARVIIEKDGIPVAALVSADDVEVIERAERQRARDFAILDEIQAALADVPEEELEREISRAVRQARERRRKQRSQAA